MNNTEIGFQSWPSKITLREILQQLGAKLCVSEDCNCSIVGFDDSDSILDKSIKVLENNGMGYGIIVKEITKVDIKDTDVFLTV